MGDDLGVLGGARRWYRAIATVAAVAMVLGPGSVLHASELPPTVEDLPEFEFDQPLIDSPWTGPVVDLVRVRKAERQLQLLSDGNLVAEYTIALGREPIGAKRYQGDGRTPEGRYVIDRRKEQSDYHLALHVSYPSSEDERRAQDLGLDAGGAIMIHGLPNGMGLVGSAHTLIDWTEGCIAVTNSEIEEIWERVRDGVPIEILP